jgi:hypothetical protein
VIEKSLLIQFYQKEGKSMQEIADYYHCSLNRVQYWFGKYGIKTRNRSDALYLKNNPNGDPFALKQILSKKDLVLMGLGLGLWWGEGSKLHKGTVRLGNTDPRLISRFVFFLTEILGVKKNKIRFGLQIFTDIDPDIAKHFWMDSLHISEEQLLPSIVVTQSGKVGTYKKKSQYGVLTVYCSNIKLRKLLDDLMSKYAFCNI